MRSFLRRLYKGWMVFAHALGRVQTYLILSLIYFLALGLIAPFVRLFMRDPLSRSMLWNGSAWSPKPPTNLSIDEARRLF